MMLRSFVEFGKRGQVTQTEDLERLTTKLGELEYLENKTEGTDFVEYVESANQIIETRRELLRDLFEIGNSRLLHSGRIIQIGNLIPAIILKVGLKSSLV